MSGLKCGMMTSLKCGLMGGLKCGMKCGWLPSWSPDGLACLCSARCSTGDYGGIMRGPPG